MNTFSRRGLLKFGFNTMMSTSLLSLVGGFQRAMAASDTSGYKALVCLYMIGGNDSFNWLVPTTGENAAAYRTRRGSLALPASSLLPLNGIASDGSSYALHPSCTEIQTLFNTGHAAFLGNVGTLVAPTTLAQYNARSVSLPLQLFSHADQSAEWMTSQPDSLTRTGWAGRIADLLTSQGYAANLGVNISVGGTNYFQTGGTTTAYSLGTTGAPTLANLNDTSYQGSARASALQTVLDQAAADSNVLVRRYASIEKQAGIDAVTVANAYAATAAVQTAFPAFPGNDIGQQLASVARMISARSAIGASRQIFFVTLNGFDTHDGQLPTQQSNLKYVSRSLDAFYKAMIELGTEQNVTTFTMSDFGRTLTPNSDGSDHGWGQHALVLGGAVKGGRIYGTMPNLAAGSADDVGQGRLLPTTATDQYAATLASWFGVAGNDLDLVLPNIRRFPQPNIGFV